MFFFFNDTATTEIYTLSLHDALPISRAGRAPGGRPVHLPRRRDARAPHRLARRDRGGERRLLLFSSPRAGPRPPLLAAHPACGGPRARDRPEPRQASLGKKRACLELTSPSSVCGSWTSRAASPGRSAR